MYILKVFILGQPGYFEYEVSTREQAMIHFGEITSKGYRRINDRKQLEWFSPARLSQVNIIGKDLDTDYPDKFKRT